jgi:hypothetical protein
MTMCNACKRRKFWLLNKVNGNCVLKEPVEMINAETGEPMIVLSDYIKKYGWDNLKCNVK